MIVIGIAKGQPVWLPIVRDDEGLDLNYVTKEPDRGYRPFAKEELSGVRLSTKFDKGQKVNVRLSLQFPRPLQMAPFPGSTGPQGSTTTSLMPSTGYQTVDKMDA